MIVNIVDHRKNKYRWLKIDAVIEDTSHDNAIENSDFSEVSASKAYIQCEDKTDISLHEAICWAENLPGRVTLFLYDLGKS